ncbi:MAG: DUF4125 family protein [Deltaproteobacteria bacterium]|nr:DUF4125 family protein [Deltaproteobacteria bacterium]
MKVAPGQKLIEKILDFEWEMFRQTRSLAPAPCQQAPQRFRQIRGAIFELWTEEMLGSYLTDLEEARAASRNLLSKKYARMDDRIPRTNFHPLIEKIVAIEANWQTEIESKYPQVFLRMCRGTAPGDDGSNFSVYLRCELETYGAKTIELYYQQVREAVTNGRNLSMDMLRILVLKGGFQSLDHAEKHLREHFMILGS